MKGKEAACQGKIFCGFPENSHKFPRTIWTWCSCLLSMPIHVASYCAWSLGRLQEGKPPCKRIGAGTLLITWPGRTVYKQVATVHSTTRNWGLLQVQNITVMLQDSARNFKKKRQVLSNLKRHNACPSGYTHDSEMSVSSPVCCPDETMTNLITFDMVSFGFVLFLIDDVCCVLGAAHVS